MANDSVEAPAIVRPYTRADLPWAESVLNREFGGRYQARRGELILQQTEMPQKPCGL